MLYAILSPLPTQVKKLIGPYQRLSVDVIKMLIKLAELREITSREVRIIAASWYIHTLYAEVNAENTRRSLTRDFTIAEITEAHTKFADYIDPKIRARSVDIRRASKKLCLELARTTSPLEQAILLLTISQGSLTKEFRFKLGQNYMAKKFNVSHQATAKALKALCAKQILERSKKPINGCYLYRYGPKIKPKFGQ